MKKFLDIVLEIVLIIALLIAIMVGVAFYGGMTYEDIHHGSTGVQSENFEFNLDTCKGL